ncbi:MAG: hypothetical protein A2925_04920 [Candidatus Yanofskybacteria bacterium RIFCSPLOWO2_01_FULL_44_22]|uniref:Uncharacterized protein n=1 Tax=Candidatus Yanofskybacteria bacterium RIFCSPLOWO2_01_FULL_44_22 TaxID=1802697 RepID=A0A1F8GLE2_9BACT|nr:MAG: hypothetical protein A2925_04920 [Candidatus Yanofskybacteria bacterium RIFCSPLOWO2_01_FULL_44_22]
MIFPNTASTLFSSFLIKKKEMMGNTTWVMNTTNSRNESGNVILTSKSTEINNNVHKKGMIDKKIEAEIIFFVI